MIKFSMPKEFDFNKALLQISQGCKILFTRCEINYKDSDNEGEEEEEEQVVAAARDCNERFDSVNIDNEEDEDDAEDEEEVASDPAYANIESNNLVTNNEKVEGIVLDPARSTAVPSSNFRTIIEDSDGDSEEEEEVVAAEKSIARGDTLAATLTRSISVFDEKPATIVTNSEEEAMVVRPEKQPLPARPMVDSITTVDSQMPTKMLTNAVKIETPSEVSAATVPTGGSFETGGFTVRWQLQKIFVRNCEELIQNLLPRESAEMRMFRNLDFLRSSSAGPKKWHCRHQPNHPTAEDGSCLVTKLIQSYLTPSAEEYSDDLSAKMSTATFLSTEPEGAIGSTVCKKVSVDVPTPKISNKRPLELPSHNDDFFSWSCATEMINLALISRTPDRINALRERMVEKCKLESRVEHFLLNLVQEAVEVFPAKTSPGYLKDFIIHDLIEESFQRRFKIQRWPQKVEAIFLRARIKSKQQRKEEVAPKVKAPRLSRTSSKDTVPGASQHLAPVSPEVRAKWGRPPSCLPSKSGMNQPSVAVPPRGRANRGGSQPSPVIPPSVQISSVAQPSVIVPLEDWTNSGSKPSSLGVSNVRTPGVAQSSVAVPPENRVNRGSQSSVISNTVPRNGWVNAMSQSSLIPSNMRAAGPYEDRVNTGSQSSLMSLNMRAPVPYEDRVSAGFQSSLIPSNMRVPVLYEDRVNTGRQSSLMSSNMRAPVPYEDCVNARSQSSLMPSNMQVPGLTRPSVSMLSQGRAPVAQPLLPTPSNAWSYGGPQPSVTMPTRPMNGYVNPNLGYPANAARRASYYHPYMMPTHNVQQQQFQRQPQWPVSLPASMSHQPFLKASQQHSERSELGATSMRSQNADQPSHMMNHHGEYQIGCSPPIANTAPASLLPPSQSFSMTTTTTVSQRLDGSSSHQMVMGVTYQPSATNQIYESITDAGIFSNSNLYHDPPSYCAAIANMNVQKSASNYYQNAPQQFSCTPDTQHDMQDSSLSKLNPSTESVCNSIPAGPDAIEKMLEDYLGYTYKDSDIPDMFSFSEGRFHF